MLGQAGGVERMGTKIGESDGADADVVGAHRPLLPELDTSSSELRRSSIVWEYHVNVSPNETLSLSRDRKTIRAP